MYKFEKADHLSNCCSHPSTKTTRFICVHEPLDAAAVSDKEPEEVYVTLNLTFLGLMTALGCPEAELITACQNAAAHIVRTKMSKRQQLLDGIDILDIDVKFVVLVTR